jgi:hypothetical protein
MQIGAYNEHSRHQLSGHAGSIDMLLDSVDRLGKRIELKEQCVQIADLGSADGSNSMATLQLAVNRLRQQSKAPIHVTFEEQPASDETSLKRVLQSHGDWFTENNMTWSVLMKSFYEPLFEPESMDLIMCYICLHWLDTSQGASDWKMLHLSESKEEEKDLLDFTFINEATAPPMLKEIWKHKLANLHLAKFFALRARELKPGAEAVLIMVGHPHSFVVPSQNASSPLTLAMQQCVQKGLLREQVLKHTIVPYFLRTADDVREAFELASTMSIDGDDDDKNAESAGSLLELVDVRSYETITGGGGEENLDGPFQLFWAIHSGAVKAANPTNNELDYIEKETRQVFDELYDSFEGISGTFLACVIKRR